MAGTNPQLAIRIAANVEELRKNLAEGRASIEALGPSVEQLTKRWQASSTTLIQNARNITAAVDKVGTATMTAGQAASSLRTLEQAMAQLERTGKPVPEQMRRVAGELQGVTGHTSSWLGVLRNVAGVIGVAFSVQQIVNFAKAILTAGDQIKRMADQTGMTTDQVQEMSYVAGQTGNTIDQLVASVGQMQNRLASGDKSAVSAVKALSLNLDELMRANPAQQFAMIAEGIGQIENPARQAQMAMDLFGRAGIQILPTLKSEYEKLRDEAPKMSRATVEALDEMGDSWERLKATALAVTANVFVALRDGANVSAIAARQVSNEVGAFDAALKAATASAPPLTVANTALVDVLGQEAAIVKQLDDERKAATETAKRAMAETKALAAAEAQLAREYRNTMNWVGELQMKQDALTESMRRFEGELGSLQQPLLATSALYKGIELTTRTLPGNIVDVAASMETWKPSVSITQQLLGSLGNVKNLVGGALQGVLTQTGHAGVQAFGAIAGALLKGDWMGAALAGITAIGKAVAGLFKSEESTSVNKPRQAWIDAAGGLEVLNPAILKATGSLDLMQDVFDAKTVKEYEAAIAAVTKALKEAADAAAGLNAVAGGDITIGETWADRAHAGGFVTTAGIQRLHEGTARVLPFVPRYHGGLAADEVHAILQTGESVLTRRATAMLGTGAIGALNRGQAPTARGGAKVTVVIQAWDGKSVDDWLRRGGNRQLAAALTEVVA
jgi:hypothetical protein